MAKESGSTRIPRFDTMNGAQTTRIPLPGSLRIQQSHIVPPNGLMQPTKIISTTKIARPSSLSGLRPPISTIASIKKSLTSEKFTEAANLVSQKTTTVVKKFLTKPEKYEKNIETKAAICEKQQQERTTNLEKGSKESSNEKLASSQVATPSTKHEKRTILTRSETFVRDETTNDILCHTYDINADCGEISVNNNTTTTNAVVNSTKILNKTQRYSLFDIPKDLIQSTPRVDNIKLKMGNTYTNNNQTLTINNKTHDVDPVAPKIINSTHNLEKTTTLGNADAFLTKTFEKTCSENLDGIVLPVVSPMKPLRRSETFSQIPDTEDHPLLDENYFNETITCERLHDISNECLNATLTISGQDLSNEYLDSTIIEQLTDINESILNKTLIIDNTLTALLPDKKDMKLQLNSTIQQNPIEKLIDFTISPRNNVMNITKSMLDSPQFDLKHQTALLYMSPQTELRHSILAPRKASSRTSLAKTPDDLLESMDIDQYGNVFDIPLNVKQALSMNALQELKQTTKPRFSFGLDLTESTLDCSIELCDISLASNAASASTGANVNNGITNSNYSYGSSIQQIESPGTLLKKQNSFDLDESLGILTPDQMKEFLDSTTTNNTNNLDLPGLIAHHSSGAMIPTNFSIGKIGSKLSLHQMRIDLTPSPEDLPLDPVEVKTDVDILMSLPPHNTHNNNNINNSNINNSTSSSSCITQSQVLPNSNTITYTELSQTDTDSKTDQMTKSNTSKVSTSFITSVTSITSLDNGYQGDGEMSRPASRGGDHSPSNGPKNKNHISRQPSFNNQHHNIPIRRQDPMTDSDFFTESDADVDIFHRGDRRAQVIDGQLYGPMHQQPAASVFISEQPEMEDSCMESSGIFTDVENRCDDDLALNRRDAIESAAAAAAAAESNDDMNGQCSSMNSIKRNSLTTSATGETDMSPDGSTDTVKSNKNDGNQQGTSNYNHSNSDRSITPSSVISQGGQYYNNGGGGGGGMTGGHSGNLLTDSQTSSTINSSLSSDRISISTDYNSTNISTATINTTQPMITTTGKRKIYNVRSSPTSNVTSPTTVFCKPITEKRAATSPLLSAAKIKASSTHKHQNVTNTSLTTTTATTTNVVNDYCSNRQNCSEIIQKTPTFKNTNSIKSIAHSVRKSSPSRKHVLTTSSSVRPSSSSSLLSSSPSSNSSSYIINSNQKNKNSSNKSTVNSNSNRKKLSLSIDFKNNGLNNYNSNKSGTVSPSTLSLDIDCRRSPSYNSASSSINGVMVLTNSNSKINLINGNNNKTINNKNTVNKRNNKNDLVNDLSLTANSSNNSSSISISTGSITNTSTNNCCDNNSPQHNNSPYRTSKYSTNKWDTVMNKIAENQKQQQQLQHKQQQQSKFSKKSYNQIKSKISTGIKMQLQQSQQQQHQQAQQNLNKNKCSNLLNNSSSVNNSVNINSDNKIIRNGSKNENLIKITKIKKLIINTSKSSPNSSVNSSFDCSTTSGLTSPQTKRLIQGATKRGRSYSKDSQQSSQSDLSLSGGSPKLIIKNSARSAKKRDVRNLSISPTDLGPPPKTQTPVTTPNGVNRTKIISTNSTQKRISPIHSQTNLTQNNNKNSPPPKKATPRRVLEQKTIVKTPLKDHNRLLSQQQQNGNLKSGSNTTVNGGINTTNRIKDNNSTIIVATNSPLSVCNGNSPTAGTKLRNGNLSHTTTTTTPHGVSNHGSPNNLQKKHLQSQQQPGQQNKTLQSHHYQKQHPQQQQQQRQQQEQKLQQLNTIQQQQKQTTCKTSLLDLSIPDGNKSIEALGVLLQYLVYDLDAFACPSIKEDYSQSQKNLFQTQSLLDDARTACSDLQDQLSDKDHFYMTREQELQTLHRCELTKVETSLKDFQTNANDRITFLELELSRKDEEHIKKFNLLQQNSDSKIQQLEKDLERARSKEFDLLKRIEILLSNENELRDRIQEAEDSFTERLQVSVQLERDLADKVTTLTRQLELTRLESEKRERELEEKLNLSQNELTIIRNNQNFMVSLNNSSSSSLTSSPLNQQQQHHHQQQQNSFNNDDDIIKLRSPKTISQIHGGGSHNNVMSLSMSSNSSNKVQMLENEVESLRSVMDIKLNDICELRKKNQELTRANEEFEGLKIKYSGMESRLEDLQIQLRAKDEEKQELLFKIKHLQEQCAQEAKNRTRVLLHNEELQYRLKQNSEKFNAFVAELSKSEYASCSKGLLSQDNLDLSQNSSLNSNISINNTPLRSNGAIGNITSGLTFEEEDSPPGSPIIKGVVKKSDSVSWVLQMDDELPEVVASRMVKRAGSFRSSFNEKVQNAKRQLSLPTGPGSINGGNNCSSHINPLQQSASATMLNPQNHQKIVTQQRQHSNSESEYGSVSSPRIRSKSINIKGCDQKKQLKQTSSGSATKKIEVPGLWKEPICSSSPYARHASKFQRTSHSPPKSQLTATSKPLVKQISKSYSQDEDDVNDTVCKNNDESAGVFSGNIYNRKNSRHLLTCDKTALATASSTTQNERLSSSSSSALPTHASVQDLKSLKKSQPQIQESAGEAMVSGTNSEDESCSGSSDESPCQSQSMSSDTNSSNSNSESDHHHHHHHLQQHKINSLAIEEALLLDKYANSLDGTPMEVSWSSDADAFPSESIV